MPTPCFRTHRDLVRTCKDIRSDILADNSFYKSNEFHFESLRIAAYYLHTLSGAQRKVLASISVMFTHGYHAVDVFQVVLQCRNLRIFHLDVSPLYFTADRRIDRTISGKLKFYPAEGPKLRHTPPPLKNDLEDFEDLPGFKEMKQINQMQSLREFSIIGRIPAVYRSVAGAVDAAAIGYNLETGRFAEQLKTSVFLPLQYNQPKPVTNEKEGAECKNG
jgi:hypothetical protein